MRRLVLVHGSVTDGRRTWGAQRPLAERYELVVLDRPGFGEGDPPERVDFEAHAAWLAPRLEPGDHLCGHSYGGIVCLLAAVRQPELASLTVVEPPCTRVAAGHPASDAFAAGVARLWTDGPRDPERFLGAFLDAVGSVWRPPSPLPRDLARGALLLRDERPPSEAEIPLPELRALRFPKLVVSGGHHPAFEAICDALQAGLGAERAIVRGAGHAAQAAPGFNATLAEFLERAESR